MLVMAKGVNIIGTCMLLQLVAQSDTVSYLQVEIRHQPDTGGKVTPKSLLMQQAIVAYDNVLRLNSRMLMSMY